jgi:exosortase A-associated hydrolase 2
MQNQTAGRRSSTAQPIFLDINQRRIFGLQIVPTGQCTGSVLYLPPFAEEMNRCRSHVVAHARAMASAGLHCLLLDFYGTGESDGSVADGDWSFWLDDAQAAANWLADRSKYAPLLWGVRTGALIAAELGHRMASIDTCAIKGLYFWQPVLDGKQFINQYLRLRIASQLVRSGKRETSDSIRADLAAGKAVEVAGYPLTGRLASAVEACKLNSFPQPANIGINWLEFSSTSSLTPQSRRVVEDWLASGSTIAVATVDCPRIWEVQEPVRAPELQVVGLRLILGERDAS